MVSSDDEMCDYNFCKVTGVIEEDAKNPLLNHLIVTKILVLAELKFEELKLFRLVCKLWYTLSLNKWRQSVVVRLVENEDSHERDEKKTGISVEEFCQLQKTDNLYNYLYKLSRKPYSNYKLESWTSCCPRRGAESTLQDAHRWTGGIAPFVKYLKIEECYFPDSKQLEDRLLTCVNLKELALFGNSSGICRGYKIPTIISDELPNLMKLNSLTVSGAMPLQWSKLLLHAPNLESLTIKQNGSFYRTTFASFLLDLHQLEFSGRNPKNLKHLDIMEADDTFTDFVSLSSRDLRLESLSIQFDQIRPEHFMQPLLQTQARSLKILKLCRVSNREEQPFGQFEFPYSVNMFNLEELYLWGNVVKNMNFLRNIPNLKVLHISRDSLEKRHLLNKTCGRECSDNGCGCESFPEDLVSGQNEIPQEMNDLVLNGMEELYMDCKLSPESIQLLRRWMPNLKRIGANLNNETLKVVCGEWSMLMEIKVLSGKLSG